MKKYTAKRIKGTDNWDVYLNGSYLGRVRAVSAHHAIEVWKQTWGD